MQDDDHVALPQDHGLPITVDSVYLDLFRLLTTFGGSRIIAAYAAEHPRSTLYDLVERFEKSEAARLLLNVAVVSRSALDHSWASPIDGNSLRYGGDVVGWLEPGPGEPREDLRFREACNKIIHALGMTFSHETAEPVRFRFLSNEVRVTGEKQNVRWIASINVLVFAECALNAV